MAENIGSISDYPAEAIGAAVAALKKYGIVNVHMQAAILATIAKESGFRPQSETSYAKTSNERIRTIFKSRVSSLSEVQLSTLKADPIKFFDHLYGNRYGNVNIGDGYKYRGRGLNQITFKGNYKAVGDIIGVDLVSNPDKLNEITTAAAGAAAYFIMFFKSGKASGKLKKKLGVNDISEVKDYTTAVKATIMANAGWDTDFSTSVVQEGYRKALATVQAFANTVGKAIDENKGTLASLFFLGLAITGVVYRKEIKEQYQRIVLKRNYK